MEGPAPAFDARYRGAGLEQRGIFAYVPNAIWTVVLPGLNHPGLLFHSRLSLALRAENALVWAHHFCTEKPDMREIYGGRG